MDPNPTGSHWDSGDQGRGFWMPGYLDGYLHRLSRYFLISVAGCGLGTEVYPGLLNTPPH